MSKKPEAEKKTLDKATISRHVRTVTSNEGFHFFREVGDSTGKTATSLADFAEKLKTIDVRSVDFHFKRQDFEKWIRDIIGDAELSRRMGRIMKEIHGERLRSEIVQAVKRRLEELKNM